MKIKKKSSPFGKKIYSEKDYPAASVYPSVFRTILTGNMNKKRMQTGSFIMGTGLIGCGIADAAFNPFAFITAPKLIGSGISLIAISLGIKTKDEL